MNREKSISNLQSNHFDLCIIGGGASGAGCALDAALRGLKVVLVEKDDFASGTSSRSTKLIHGGVRYLEQAFKNLDLAQLRQVRHGLHERHTLLSNAPHLSRPLALVTPVFNWLEGLYYRIGLWLYDQIAAHKDQLPSSRWLNRREALDLLPGLNQRLHSAVLYYDGQLDDARYCLALVQSAAEAGATVLNYAEVLGFSNDDAEKITGVAFRDLIGNKDYTVNARCVLNCTGPWADQLRMLANPDLPQRIRPSKGVHITLPLSILGNPDTALLIPKTTDGRVVFAVPFFGKFLVGTTDQDFPELSREPRLQSAEIEYLLNTIRPYLRQPVSPQAVQAGYGGLRPLVVSTNRQLRKSTKGLLRDHEVEQDPESGLFSLLGGKWTTYRLMARDAVDAVCQYLGSEAACTTDRHGLAGSEQFSPLVAVQLENDFELPKDIAQHLAANYGSRARTVAELARQQPSHEVRLHADYPFIRAEVVHAVRVEMACTLRDVLARRIRLEILDWAATLEAIPVVANLMAAELGWNAQEKSRQETTYVELIRAFMQATGK